jgi:lipopolysaccharide transport system permease protein
MMLSALGLGLWLAALAIQYRDVKHAMTFVVQLLMYIAPVVYPTSMIPKEYTLPNGWVIWPQWIYALNPMVGVIEGFRAALLGTRPMPYGWIAMGTITAAILVATGAVYFRSREKLFADVA